MKLARQRDAVEKIIDLDPEKDPTLLPA